MSSPETYVTQYRSPLTGRWVAAGYSSSLSQALDRATFDPEFADSPNPVRIVEVGSHGSRVVVDETDMLESIHHHFNDVLGEEEHQ